MAVTFEVIVVAIFACVESRRANRESSLHMFIVTYQLWRRRELSRCYMLMAGKTRIKNKTQIRLCGNDDDGMLRLQYAQAWTSINYTIRHWNGQRTWKRDKNTQNAKCYDMELLAIIHTREDDNHMWRHRPHQQQRNGQNQTDALSPHMPSFKP